MSKKKKKQQVKCANRSNQIQFCFTFYTILHQKVLAHKYNPVKLEKIHELKNKQKNK